MSTTKKPIEKLKVGDRIQVCDHLETVKEINHQMSMDGTEKVFAATTQENNLTLRFKEGSEIVVEEK